MPVKLQTPVKAKPPTKQLDSSSVIASIGSCFSQNITQRFLDCGFSGMQNPNGIVYNSVSISHAIDRIVNGLEYCASDFFEHNGLWHSWLHHGSFSDHDLNTAVKKANTSMNSFGDILKTCNLFIMTPSSSVVYVFNKTGEIVANCHKVPNNQFTRRLLTVDENSAAISNTINRVQSVNPDCQIVITLSPIRHYPGELTLNSVSKAHLITAIHAILEKYKDVSYFPSYEIVLDELRDYRFYADDMMHLTGTAEEIIFERFLETFFTADTQQFLDKNRKELRQKAHRALR